jgi:hypothetical protein
MAKEGRMAQRKPKPRKAPTGRSLRAVPPTKPEVEEPKTADHPVGAVVRLPNGDDDPIRASFQPIVDAQARLGAARERFAAEERELLSMLAKSREQYNATVIAAGRRIGLSVGPGSDQAWNFNVERMEFQRVQ